MSPFEPQDTLMENSTAPTTTNAMACPPPTASGRDNAAAGSTPSSNGAAAVAPAAATDGAPSATPKPQPPQNTERPTTAACPPAINTTTGLISPLTTLKNSAKSSSSTSSSTSPTPASILKKMTPTTKKKHHNHHHRHVEMTLPNTPQVDSYKISKIGQAREKIKRSFDKSKLLENDEYVFPRFEMEELTLGEVLGQGGFGTVLEIKAMEVVHHTHTPSLSPTTSAEAAINSNEEMERQVFRIDDVHKRKRSHSFRLRRRNHHENHHHHHFGFGGSLKFSNSHDGCEGLGNNHGLASIIERDSMDIPSSRSHDCVEGDVPEAAPSAAAEGDTNSSVPKRELRVKALSWSHAKAKAHDVSQFFHRSPKSGGGDEDQNVETKESHESEGENVTTNNNDEVRPREERKKSISYDSSLLRRGNGASYTPTGGSMHDRYPRRASRNFSFLSWRDSEAGEEGNDAISPEELLKYNIDLSYYSTTQQHNIYETLDTHSEGDEKEDALQDKKQRRGSCPSGQTNEYIVEKEMNNRGRRIILFPSPKKAIPAETPEDEARTAAFYQDKSFITQHATNSEGEARYVIKIISANIVENDFKKFLQAAMDMATETYFLSVLNHPNILKMRAVGQGDMFSPSYFLVLDRLYDTLNDRIEGAWKTQFDHLENSIFVWNRAAKLKALWEERMGVMKDLAGALDYLHELKIIYRDIKPENVGFDSRGNVKLFDFGLAKELHEEDECSNGTYKLTPNTGSIRYMSPENGNKWPYNVMADSYSFGIMLWEVIALERPFSSYTPREIRDMVMRWGERPKTREEWPERIVDLMKSAWDSNFRKRPTMKAIEATLEKEMEDSGVW